MDCLYHASLEDQVLQSGFHSRKHVDTKPQCPEQISCKVQSLQALAGGVVDDHGDGDHGVAAQAQAAELLAGEVEESSTQGGGSGPLQS